MIHRLIVGVLSTLLFVPAAAFAQERRTETETETEIETETETEVEDGRTETETETEIETESETETETEDAEAAEDDDGIQLMGGPAASLDRGYDSELDEGYYSDVPGFFGRVGMAAEVGGGVYGFTDPGMRDVVDVGGLWNARLVVGTRTLLGVEVAYVGTASGLDALGLDDDAVLVANGGEAAVRLNLMRGSVRPFLFGGVGFKHYQLVNESFNTSSVRQSDDVLELPVGAGVDFEIADRLILGGRFAVRPAFDEDLVGSTGEPEMHTMSGDLRLGYSF